GPGADVKGGGDAGQREGEDLVGRGDARPAVGGHRTAVGRAERGEAGGQVGGRAEGAVRVHVRGRRGAERAGNVAGYRVDVLALAPVALARAGVEQQAGAGGGRRAGGVEEAELTGAGGEAAGRSDRPFLAGGRDRVAARGPGPEPAVEHADRRVAEVAQQPPGPGRGGGVGVVVDDHGPAVAHAGPLH